MIKERIEISHGLQPDKIRSLLLSAGLKEITCNLSKSEYRGIFVSNLDVH